MFGRRHPVAQVGRLSQPIRRFVQERVARRLGIPADQPLVRAQRRGTTFLVTVRAGSATSRCAVCPRLRHDHLQDAATLQRVHAAVRASCEDLACGLPMVLDIEPQRQWLVFEYLAGRPLLHLLHAGLRQGSLRSAFEPLEHTARLLARINALPAPKLGLAQPVPLHADYVRQMDLCTADPRVRRWLPDAGCWQAAVARATGPGFEKRCGDRLMLVDCQPKNVLVSPAGQARCIDIDYATGNPALNVAQFLISLDRLALRHPHRRRRQLLADCKAAFTRSYARYAEPWIIGDLAFFYPWLLMRAIRQHPRLHPLLAGYIRRTYGRTLRQFLLNLDQGLPVSPSLAVPLAA